MVTSIEVVVNGESRVGDAVKKLDYVNENAISRCTLTLSDVSSYSELMQPNNTVTAGAGGVELFRGYLDDISPMVNNPSFVWEKEVELKCRGYGRALLFNHLTKAYSADRLDRLNSFMQDALNTTGVGLTHPGGLIVVADPLVEGPMYFPFINAKLDRTYLVDAFNEAVSACSPPYDFTVDNNQRLRLWPLDHTPHSGVTLRSVADAPDNNILLIDPAAKISSDLKNHIRIDAGSLNDDWTETNASDWQVNTGTSVAPPLSCTLYDDGVVCAAGKTSIRAEFVASGATPYPRYARIYLEFTSSNPLYGQSSLDLSDVEETACRIFMARSNTQGLAASIYLMDSADREIFCSVYPQEFYVPMANRWYKYDFKMGYDVSGWQSISGGAVSQFNWNLKRIGLWVAISTPGVFSLWFDGLRINGVNVFAEAWDGQSIGDFGKRMVVLNRTDVKNQVRLQQIAQSELAARKDPLRTLQATCTFQPGLLYTGHTVDVYAPDVFIGRNNVAVRYRVISVQHVVEPGVDLCRGYDAITKLELAEHAEGVVIDRNRSRLAGDSQGAINNRYGSRITVLEKSFTDTDSIVSGLSMGGGGGYSGQGILTISGAVPTYVWEQIEPCLWGYDSLGHWTAIDEVLELGESFLHFSQPDGHYLDVGMIIRDPQRIDNLTDPILYVSQHLLVKKDFAAGGSLYSAQGALVLGHGWENKDDPPQIMLQHSTNQYANKDTLNIRLAANAGWGKLKCDSVFVDHIFKMDGSEWGAGLWNGGTVSNNVLVSYANSPGNAPSVGVQSTNNQSVAFNLQIGSASPGNVVGSFGYDSANNRCVLNSSGQALRLTAATGGIWLEHDTIFNGLVDIRASSNEPLMNWSSSAGFIRGVISYYSGTFQLDSRGASSLTIASQSGTPIYLSPGTLNGTSPGHVVLRFGRHLNPETNNGGQLGETGLRWGYLYTNLLDYKSLSNTGCERQKSGQIWPHTFSDYTSAAEKLTHEATKTKYHITYAPESESQIICTCGKPGTGPCVEHEAAWRDKYTVNTGAVIDATAYMTLEHAATLAHLTQQNLDLEERLTLIETQLTQTLTKKLAPPEVNN